MTDITKLAKRLRVLSQWQTGMGTSEPEDHIAWVAADALEAQAKEIAELKAELNAWHEAANWPEKSPGQMRARIAELEEALDKADAALSWMLLEGCDEAIPETCPTEYQSCVDALQSVRAALNGEQG